ncbi:Uncharacterized protein PBTT_05786 [Plasmodiophora brassicae]
MGSSSANRHDPRRRSYFDTPPTTSNDESGDEGAPQPRRKKRQRRVSLGVQLCNDDGFEFRRRPTKISSAPAEETHMRDPISKLTQESPSVATTKSKPRKTTPKLVPVSASVPAKESKPGKPTPVRNDRVVAPETPLKPYPESLDWKPSVVDDGSPAEAQLIRLLKEVTSHEIAQCAAAFDDERHAFLHDRISAACKEFVNDCQQMVLKLLSDRGALKPPKVLKNTQNESLREQERIWTAAVDRIKAELADWAAIRHACPTLPIPDVVSTEFVSAYLDEQGLSDIGAKPQGEEDGALMREFTRVLAKADAILASAHTISGRFDAARDAQAHVVQTLSREALRPLQPITEPKALIASVLATGRKATA